MTGPVQARAPTKSAYDAVTAPARSVYDELTRSIYDRAARAVSAYSHSAYERVARSAYTQPETQAYGALKRSAYTATRVAAYLPRPRQVVRRLVLVSKPRPPSADLWVAGYNQWFTAFPDLAGDEYDPRFQLKAGDPLDFTRATDNFRSWCAKQGLGYDAAACIADPVERAEEACVADDGEDLPWRPDSDGGLVASVGDIWDDILPEIRRFRDSLAHGDLEWLIDTVTGDVLLHALKWAGHDDTFSGSGQQLREHAKAVASFGGYRNALLDLVTFAHGYMIEEGEQLFEELSRLWSGCRFPYLPRQVLVFRDEDLTEQSERQGSHLHLGGVYEVEHTEYRSNLGDFAESPVHSVVGWRLHFMTPRRGGAC